jgi:hypothetical protein
MEETMEKTWKHAASQGRERAVKYGEHSEKYRIPGASRRNEREDAHGRTKEDKVRGQKKKKKNKKKKKKIMMMMTTTMMTMTTLRMMI